jgi:HTH-like domain
MIASIDATRNRFGVEPICQVLPIALSASSAAKRRPPSARALRDEELKLEIARVHQDNLGVYGAPKIWRQLHREGISVGRCTVERLMVSWACRACAAGRLAGPPRPTRAPLGRLTWWGGTSRQPGPTSCGSPISPGWPPGRALSMWPLSWMPSAGSSWAGRRPGRCELTWRWPRWRWRSGSGTGAWMGWCTTPTVSMWGPGAPGRPDPHSDGRARIHGAGTLPGVLTHISD